jgi:hypothetical protein
LQQWFNFNKDGDISLAFKNAFAKNLDSVDDHLNHVSKTNKESETNDCLLRLVPFAIWSSGLS